MKDHKFKILISFLIAVLIFVSFYMFWVHIPYYNHEQSVKKIRNEICETNNYQYLGYCYEYYGQSKCYILKVNEQGQRKYVAYDQSGTFLASYSDTLYSKSDVINKIAKAYNLKKKDVPEIEICYENKMFLYYCKIQTKSSVTYVYYDLKTGDLVKSYRLRSES